MTLHIPQRWTWIYSGDIIACRISRMVCIQITADWSIVFGGDRLIQYDIVIGMFAGTSIEQFRQGVPAVYNRITNDWSERHCYFHCHKTWFGNDLWFINRPACRFISLRKHGSSMKGSKSWSGDGSHTHIHRQRLFSMVPVIGRLRLLNEWKN